MVRREPRGEPVSPRGDAEHREVGVGQVAQVRVGDAADLRLLLAGREARARGAGLRDRLVAARPAPPYFVKRSITTERAGMLMPRESVSVAKTTLSSPASKHSSTVSRNTGTNPA